MRTLTVLALMLATPLVAAAQDAIPQLKGTWKGTGKILLFGTTEHLSGSPSGAVVRDLEVTHTVTGQDGRLIWGTTSSANNDSKEPFRVGALRRQPDDCRCRHRWLLPHHCRFSRPDREMLRPERDGAATRHRGHLLHNGSGQELARGRPRTPGPIPRAGRVLSAGEYSGGVSESPARAP
jgi:hypothetical protein